MCEFTKSFSWDGDDGKHDEYRARLFEFGDSKSVFIKARLHGLRGVGQCSSVFMI